MKHSVVLRVSLIAMAAWLGATNCVQAAPIFTENFNTYAGIQNATQYQTGLPVAHSGNVTGWSNAGFNAFHAVKRATAPDDWAIMFYNDNVITLTTGIGANDNGVTYQVEFDYGTADYGGGQATTAADGLLVEVLRADNSVLATDTYLPGAWANPTNANLSAGLHGTLQYVGDGSGDVRLRIGPTPPLNTGRFEGEIDNLTVSRSSLSVTVTSPTDGQEFWAGPSISATVTIENGTSPYTVTVYTNSAVAWSTNNTSANLFAIDLGALAEGTYTCYATVTDSASPSPATAASATNRFTVALTDTNAPTPNPMTFAAIPTARDTNSIVMTATTATDALSPPVEYYFENTNNSVNSGWIPGTVWTNTGLTAGTVYGYRVKARDAAVPPHETAFSAVFNAVPAEPTAIWDSTPGAPLNDGAGPWLGAGQWWNGVDNLAWNNSIPNNAVIGAGGAGGTITLGAVVAGSVVFTNFTGTYTLSGGSLDQSGGITVAANAGAVAISTAIGGSGGITKSGNSTLTLSGANSYSGDTVINAGTVAVSADNQLGAVASGITFNGTPTFGNDGNWTIGAGRTITLNAGAKPSFNFGGGTIAGPVVGSGGFSVNKPSQGNPGLSLTNTNNTFTGPMDLNDKGANGNAPYIFNSMGDAPGAGIIKLGFIGAQGSAFYWGSGAIMPLVLNYRQFDFLNGSINNNNTASSHANTITVNTDLLATGTGNRTLTLGGANTGANTFAGAITDGPSAVVSLNKADSGMWLLSGTNTYSGGTTISGGTLEIGGAGVLGGGAYAADIVNNATFGYSSTATQTLSGAISGTGALIKNNTGVLTLAGTNTYSGATTIRGGTLWGVTGGGCANSAVTVTNTPGNVAALGVRVTDSSAPWICPSLAFNTNGVGAQLEFSVDVAPSTTLAPLNITGNLTFNGVPLVVVDMPDIDGGVYPLLVVGGTAPSVEPELRLHGSGGGPARLVWGGPGKKTLFLQQPRGAVLIVR